MIALVYAISALDFFSQRGSDTIRSLCTPNDFSLNGHSGLIFVNYHQILAAIDAHCRLFYVSLIPVQSLQRQERPSNFWSFMLS